MADVPVPSIATATPAADDTVLGVKGGAVKRFLISALRAFVQAGTGAATRTTQDKLRDVVHVADFGAVGDGTTDDLAAIVNAIAALADGGRLMFGNGKHYRVTGSLTIAQNIELDGNGCTITSTSTTIFNLTAPEVKVSGFRFESTLTGSQVCYAVYCASDSVRSVNISKNIFGRCSVELRDANIDNDTPSISAVRIQDNDFVGDYTGATGGDTTNIISLRGVAGAYVTNNDFNVINVERFIKSSSSSRNVVVTGNSFVCASGTIGKQAIDAFSDSRQMIVQGNVFDLAGFTTAFDNKNGDNNPTYAEPSELLVKDNIIKMAGTSSNAIFIAGAWGLTEGTLARNTADVSGNTILISTSTATDGHIIVRGMTHAKISGNTLWRDTTPAYGVAIEASNNKLADVSGNTCSWGNISISAAASHPNGTTYQNPPETVLVTGNILEGFTNLGGAYIAGSGQTIARVLINDNSMVAAVGTGSSGRIRLSNITVTNLTVRGNYGTSLTVAGVIAVSGAAVTNWNMSGNVWQVGKTAYAGATITNGSSSTINVTNAGAAVGDAVAIGLPYDLQGCAVQARVSANDNVQIVIRNNTGGNVTLAAGTFSAVTSRV